ncbi:hypothetical protein ACQPZK_05935 [Micromonospora sp. CA-249363]|uniref:hypothetical protein n=1 Tax=Micromonospora sp. CA-249363 TaxID=3239963 RepID=UPI003D8D6914
MMASGLLRPGPSLVRGARLNPAHGIARRLIPLLLLVMVPLVLLGWFAVQTVHAVQEGMEQSGRIEEYQLVGPRGPACLRIVIVVDVSGSMSEFALPRDRALERLFTWLGTNLRTGDELAVVDFAAEAATRVPATDYRAARLTGPAGVVDGVDTLLQPPVTEVARLGATDCDVELMFISDALITDLPDTADDGRRFLTTTGMHGIHLLVPGEDMEISDQWQVAFPAAPPIRFDGNDADETALTLGRTVAALTGQRLERRPEPTTT